MEKISKGVLYAITSALCFSLWAIFSTLSFNYYNPFTTVVLWFGFSAIVSFLIIVFSGRLKEYKESFLKYRNILLITTLLNSASVITSFYALDLLGPSLTGFLSRIYLILIVLSGIIFLNEKFNILEALSALVVILGVLLISYSKGEYIVLGIIIIIIHSLLIAAARTILKSKLDPVDSMFLVNYRAIAVTIYGLIFALIIGKFNLFISKGLLFATIPSIFSVILGHLFVYKAYKLIEMSKVELITALQPFIIAALSFLVFREVLTVFQFTGGIIIVIGVIALIYARKKACKEENKKNC